MRKYVSEDFDRLGELDLCLQVFFGFDTLIYGPGIIACITLL